jgi:hypothetical protein
MTIEELLLAGKPAPVEEFKAATGWETQPEMVQKLVETRVRCQAILNL